MRSFLLFFSLTFSLFGIDAYNGKTSLIVLDLPSGYLTVGDKNISVLAHPTDRTRGIALVPIDYYAPESDQNVTWVTPAFSRILSLHVAMAPYPSETLSVDPSKVTPPLEALERIARERAQAKAIYGHFTPIRYWDKPFIRPIESITTSAYGSARIYNGSLKSYHGGVDFRALTPTPILAANDGIVVLVQDRYYSGGTIIIDHGEGLYTCYFHLSQFNVNIGDYVQRGQNIALSGDSGRITGPHLHFGMMVQGVQADPLNLLEQINALFDTAPTESL
jgi:murein DD-endopeptidase MepM/ murein hydrolase activator NlpD